MISRRTIITGTLAVGATTLLAACSNTSQEETDARAERERLASEAAANLNAKDALVHESVERKEVAESAALGLQDIFRIARTQAGEDPSEMFNRASENVRLEWNRALVKASDDALKNYSPGGSRVDWLNDLAKQEDFDFPKYVSTIKENTILRDGAFYEESMTDAERTAFNMYWAVETNYAFGKSRSLTKRYGTTVFLAEPVFSEKDDVKVIDDNTVEVSNFTAKVVPDGTAVPIERTRGSWAAFRMVRVDGAWRIDARSYLNSCETSVKNGGGDYPLDYRVDREGKVRDGNGKVKAKLQF